MPNNEEMPLQGTVEMVGAKPEAIGNKAESREYRDIGEQRLAAAGERVRALGSKIAGFSSRAWGRVKSFGAYALATPEMVRDVGSGVKEELVQGGQFVAERARESYDNAKDLAAAGASRAFEGAVYAYDATKEGVIGMKEDVVWAGEKVKSAYEGTLKWGGEKWEGLRQRAEDAKGVFGAMVMEARRRNKLRKDAREGATPEFEIPKDKLEEAMRIATLYQQGKVRVA